MDMGAEPARLATTTRKRPAPGRAIAAIDRLHLARRRAPGENAGIGIEDLARAVMVEIGRDHGADAALAEAPGGARIGLGDLLDHSHEDVRRDLGAADALRQEQAIE